MKFKVGEIAILASGGKNPLFKYSQGDECEVIRVGPFPRGEPTSDGDGWNTLPSDYEVSFGGDCWFVLECDLRKRQPPTNYKDQYTPATKPLDEIIRDYNTRVKDPDRVGV